METTETPTPVDQLKLLGGDVALDFTNTVAWEDNRPISERLTSYDRLLAWAGHAGLIDAATRRRLADAAERNPDAAARVVVEAVALRGVIHRIFAALSHGQEPAEEDLARLNAALATTLRHARVVPRPEGFVWGWENERVPDLTRPLWPIVRAAAELLVSGQLERVRECAGDRCGWLFVDTSKSGRRRWCSMEDCGNRAKARRHYQRHKDEHPSVSQVVTNRD